MTFCHYIPFRIVFSNSFFCHSNIISIIILFLRNFYQNIQQIIEGNSFKSCIETIFKSLIQTEQVMMQLDRSKHENYWNLTEYFKIFLTENLCLFGQFCFVFFNMFFSNSHISSWKYFNNHVFSLHDICVLSRHKTQLFKHYICTSQS